MGGMHHILILGGTIEARQLAAKLAGRADLGVTLSLAGRTSTPAVQAVPTRVGGFGGTDGLVAYLTASGIDIVVDATHPYAATISWHAAEAVRRAGIRLLALHRPPWTAVAGDRWTETGNVELAVDALGSKPRRVFLTIGRNEVGAFNAAPHHDYVVRSVDPVDPPLAVPSASYIVARGPFAEADERACLAAHRIEVVVAKNSGGLATYGKIAAARALGLDVVMLSRPALPSVPAVGSVADAVTWLDHALTSGTERGV